MGSTKISSSSTATPTAEEKEMEKIQLGQYKDFAPQQTEMFKSAYGLGNQLLQSFGDQDSNMWKSLVQGISPEQTQSMISEQQRYMDPQWQQQGLMDSGLRYTGNLRAATQIGNQNAQFNVGTLQNALNLALTGQAQVQGSGQTATSQLGQQLAGLRANQSQTTLPYMGTNLGILGTWGGNFCWVASEIYGGWYEPKTIAVRYYIANLAPKWFKNLYIKYGERIAKFIHNKPIFKIMLRPLFDYFVKKTIVLFSY
jgi:hypothetical protein